MDQKVRRRWGKNGGLGTNWIKRGAKIYGSTNISKKEPTVNGMMKELSPPGLFKNFMEVQ